MCQNAELQLLSFQPSTQTMSKPMVRIVQSVGKVNHFRESCRSGKNRTSHDLEQKPDQHHEEEYHLDMVNINSIIFNSKWSVITKNLKKLSNQVSIIV